MEIWPVEEGPNARLRFRYANGVEVRLTFPDKRPFSGPRLGAIFVGEKCKIHINRNKITTNPPDFAKEATDPMAPEPGEGPRYIVKPHLQNWFDRIKSRQKPNADAQIGHRAATICHLCNITRELGRRLRWDPDRELFPDDDEANALLDRPRRKAWELPDLS